MTKKGILNVVNVAKHLAKVVTFHVTLLLFMMEEGIIFVIFAEAHYGYSF